MISYNYGVTWAHFGGTLGSFFAYEGCFELLLGYCGTTLGSIVAYECNFASLWDHFGVTWVSHTIGNQLAKMCTPLQPQANFQRLKGGLSNLSLDGMNQFSFLWRLPVLLATNISPGERWHWPCGMARSGALARPDDCSPYELVWRL